MVEKSDIYQSAQTKVKISPAELVDAEQALHDADRYVADTLMGLERELKRVLAQVGNKDQHHPTKKNRNRFLNCLRNSCVRLLLRHIIVRRILSGFKNFMMKMRR